MNDITHIDDALEWLNANKRQIISVDAAKQLLDACGVEPEKVDSIKEPVNQLLRFSDCTKNGVGVDDLSYLIATELGADAYRSPKIGNGGSAEDTVETNVERIRRVIEESSGVDNHGQ